MTAEYAMRAALLSPTYSPLTHTARITVHSAGLVEAPHEIVDFVCEFLLHKGIDVSTHQPKLLNSEHLQAADLKIAMDVEHQSRIQDLYKVDVPLFSSIAYGTNEPLPDVCDMVPNWRVNKTEAKAYGQQVMQYIFDGIPGIVEHLQYQQQP